MVMLPAKRAELLVKKAANQTFTRRKAAVVKVAMKEVLEQNPNWDAGQIKHDPKHRVPAARHE